MHITDVSRSKLDALDELFPPERLARSRARWSALWRGEPPPDRYPFVYMPTFNYYNDVDTPERRLDKTLDECLLHGRLHDDFIPSVFPGLRQATIPNLFGAREIVMENDLNHLETIGATIREHGLLVDASIYGIWPQGPATAWSAADWDEARRRDERVERWATQLGTQGDAL